MLDRAKAVDEQFRILLLKGDFPDPHSSTSFRSEGIDALMAWRLFRSQLLSRHLDLKARALKEKGLSFYTIGSSGHEGMAAVAAAFRVTDPAFLHYRDAGFFIERSHQVENFDPAYALMLSFLASKTDAISGGRHKVLGSVALNIPPKSSTIASHFPRLWGLLFLSVWPKS